MTILVRVLSHATDSKEWVKRIGRRARSRLGEVPCEFLSFVCIRLMVFRYGSRYLYRWLILAVRQLQPGTRPGTPEPLFRAIDSCIVQYASLWFSLGILLSLVNVRIRCASEAQLSLPSLSAEQQLMVLCHVAPRRLVIGILRSWWRQSVACWVERVVIDTHRLRVPGR